MNPQARGDKRLLQRTWRGAQGLAEDVRYYGRWMRDEAEKRIDHLYPKVRVTAEMAQDRPDLAPYVDRDLTVIAWLWARTVKSPNPAFADVEVPLASTFILSKKKGKEAYVEPVIEDGCYRFTVKAGAPPESAGLGTTAGKRRAFRCLMSDVPVPYDHIRAEGQAGRIGARLMAIVAEGDRGRVYLTPTAEHETVAGTAKPGWKPEVALPDNPRDFKTPNYGMTTFGDLFTARQLVALTTFSDLVAEAREHVQRDAVAAAIPDDGVPLREGGAGATAYAEAVAVYLAVALSRLADILQRAVPLGGVKNPGSQSFWSTGNPDALGLRRKQRIRRSSWRLLCQPWQYGQGTFTRASVSVRYGLSSLMRKTKSASSNKVVSIDPPYYDNIGYADLSDFFYVWLRRSLKSTIPNLFATLVVPKSDELVASPYRHGNREKAEAFFLDGMTRVMRNLADQPHPAFPVTIYYAFKQSERRGDNGFASTGWETFLGAVIDAGFAINGTWPMRTELSNRMLGNNTNVLASSIVLVCRSRGTNAPTATRREFQDALRTALPEALSHLQRSNIAPVDLAQASIGPGMGIFTRYREVLNADGSTMSVRDALALINATLDEVLAEQEGNFDSDSRWALAWFEQVGFTESEYGLAETLSKAKNTSVDGLVDAGIVVSRRGTVRLLEPAELGPEWDPASDRRLTVWEMTHHLIRALAVSESEAGDLAAVLGSRAETARDLAYRLYTVSERRKRAADALQYNGLVQSWPEIVRIAGEQRAMTATQGALAIDGA